MNGSNQRASQMKLDSLPPNVLDQILRNLTSSLDSTTEWNSADIAQQVLPFAPICTSFCQAVLRRLQELWITYQRDNDNWESNIIETSQPDASSNQLLFTAAIAARSVYLKQRKQNKIQNSDVTPTFDNNHTYKCRIHTAWRLLNIFWGSNLVLNEQDSSVHQPSETPCQLSIYSLVHPPITQLNLGPYQQIPMKNNAIETIISSALRAVASTVKHILIDIPTGYMPLNSQDFYFPELTTLSIFVTGIQNMVDEIELVLDHLQKSAPNLSTVSVEVIPQKNPKKWFETLTSSNRKELLSFPWLQRLPSSVCTLKITLPFIEEEFTLPLLPHVKHLNVTLALVDIQNLMQLAEMNMFPNLETLHFDRCEYRFPQIDKSIFSGTARQIIKYLGMCEKDTLDANGLSFLTQNCTHLEVFNAHVEPKADARAAFGDLLEIATQLHSVSCKKPFLEILKDEYPIAADTIIHSKSILQGFLKCPRNADVELRCIMITDFAITLPELVELLKKVGSGIEVLMIELYSSKLQEKQSRHEQVHIDDIVTGLQEVRKRCPRLKCLSFGNLEKMDEVDNDLQYVHEDDVEDLPSPLSIELDLMEKTYEDFYRGLFTQGFMAAPPLQ